MSSLTTFLRVVREVCCRHEWVTHYGGIHNRVYVWEACSKCGQERA